MKKEFKRPARSRFLNVDFAYTPGDTPGVALGIADILRDARRADLQLLGSKNVTADPFGLYSNPSPADGFDRAFQHEARDFRAQEGGGLIWRL